jgi:hypothetical protein
VEVLTKVKEIALQLCTHNPKLDVVVDTGNIKTCKVLLRKDATHDYLGCWQYLPQRDDKTPKLSHITVQESPRQIIGPNMNCYNVKNFVAVSDGRTMSYIIG